jgi:putative thioredoxin
MASDSFSSSGLNLGTGPIGGAPGAPGATDGLIKDVDQTKFVAEVIQASREKPVIVDFWADWCAPCRQLTPVLERLVREAGGAVTLAKINVDQNRELMAELAQAGLQVQSLPTVIAFKNGQPLDGFVGAQPESQIRAMLQRLTGDSGPSPLETQIEAAQAALEAGDLAAAAQAFGAVLQQEPGHPRALAGLARCYLANGDVDRAEQMLALAPPEAMKDPEMISARAALDLATQTVDESEAAPLRARLEADPDDHQARFDLALALNAGGDREGAVEALLEIVRRNRTWNEEAARKQLLTLFEAYGPADPVTLSGRRRLSSLLFS